MPAKRKIAFNKKAKNVEVETENEVEKVENEVKNEEITVSFVEEWKISDAEITNWTTIHSEEEIGLKKPTKWTKFKKSKVIGEIGWTKVEKPVWRIKFEAQVAPYPMFMLPEDIRKYLIKKWFNSEIYKKDKEWLEKHNVDMEIVEKLKQFLTERL